MCLPTRNSHTVPLPGAPQAGPIPRPLEQNTVANRALRICAGFSGASKLGQLSKYHFFSPRPFLLGRQHSHELSSERAEDCLSRTILSIFEAGPLEKSLEQLEHLQSGGPHYHHLYWVIHRRVRGSSSRSERSLFN